MTINYPLIQTIEDAVDSFRTLGKRSLLALLGIVIGSASIVAVINIGHNARQDAAAIFQSMGVDTFIAQLSDKEGAQSAHLSIDAARIRGLQLPGVLIAPTAVAGANVGFNGQSAEVQVVGTEPALAQAMRLYLSYGRFLHNFDQGENTAVLGHEVAASLSNRGVQIKIGDWLRINTYLFRVVGILKARPNSMIDPVRVDSSVFVPMNAMGRVVSTARLNNIVVRTPKQVSIEDIAPQLLETLARELKSRNVELIVPQQIIDGMARQNITFHYLLMALGAITLVGGGVAVMNVMYMNVSERRMEIGLRLAIGARRRDIRNLFLLEALSLSALGAVLGACLGIALAYVYAQVLGWAFEMDPYSVPLGITSTVLVGVFFGLKPAIAASRLTPVEALRDH